MLNDMLNDAKMSLKIWQAYFKWVEKKWLKREAQDEDERTA